MADEKVIVEIGAVDNASGKIDDVANKTESMGSKLKASFDGAEASSKKFALALAGIGAAAIAMGAMAFKAYNEAEVSQKSLEHAVLAVTKGTQEQLTATMALADELERKGVLDGDNIKTGLAQLSTFGLSNEAVRNLGGSLADLAVNQFGVNASSEQLSDSANMIAKALKGQFRDLEKSGIRFTELQKHIIETGTEMEKTAAINEGFAKNLKFTNEVAMLTGQGLIAHVGVQLGNIQEAFGKAVSEGITPMIRAFSLWLDSFGGADAVVQALINKFEVLKPYWPLIIGAIVGGLIPAFLGLAGAIWLAMAPLIPWIAAGTAVAAIAYLIYEAYQTNFLGFRDIVTTVIDAITPALIGLRDFFILFSMGIGQAIDQLKAAWELNMFGIRDIANFVWTAITMYFTAVFDIIKGIFKIGLGIITLDWKTVWEGIKLVLKGVFEYITLGVRIFWEGLKTAWAIGGDSIKNMWGSLMDGISGIASSIWEGIKNTFKKGINAIIGYINGFISTYNTAISKVPGGKGLVLPTFTPLAAGGIVTRPTFALIGEAGPEAVIPLGKGRGAGVGGGVTVVLSNNQFYGDDEGFIQKISDSILKMLEPHISYA